MWSCSSANRPAPQIRVPGHEGEAALTTYPKDRGPSPAAPGTGAGWDSSAWSRAGTVVAAAPQVLITTFGGEVGWLNRARREIGYDHLVIVTEQDRPRLLRKVLAAERIAGTPVELLRVEPEDFSRTLGSLEQVIRVWERKGWQVRFNFSGGSKLLAAAAFFACLSSGVPTYYTTTRTIEVPTLRGIRVEEFFTAEEQRVLCALDRTEPRGLSQVESAAGVARARLVRVLRRLQSDGYIEVENVRGAIRVTLRPTGAFYRRGLERSPSRIGERRRTDSARAERI